MRKTGLLSKFTSTTMSAIAAIIAFIITLSLEGLLVYPAAKAIFELLGRNKNDVLIPSISAAMVCGFFSLWIVLLLIRMAETVQSYRIYAILIITLLIIGTLSIITEAGYGPAPYQYFIKQFVIMVATAAARIIGAYMAIEIIEEKRGEYKNKRSLPKVIEHNEDID